MSTSTSIQQQPCSCTVHYGMDILHDVDPRKLGAGTLVGKHPEDGGLMVVFPINHSEIKAAGNCNKIEIDGQEIAVFDSRSSKHKVHVVSACRQWWEEFELAGIASGLIRVSRPVGGFECTREEAEKLRAVYGGTHYVKENCLILDLVDMEARTAFVKSGLYGIRWGRSGVFAVNRFGCIWHPDDPFTIVPF